jgi:hypothetical protein
VTEAGTPVVWIRGYDCYSSCLSEELVRAGLVDMDDARWEDYTFTVPRKGVKGGKALENWRGILHKAKEGYMRGEKPQVLFEWPSK